MSARALRLIRDEVGSQAEEDSVWLGWLLSHLDERWRPGEWDRELWLFTGDADNDRTGTWRCHTPGCVVATDRANGLCEGCRRERTRPTVHGERAGGPLATRATGAEQTCSVPGCGS